MNILEILKTPYAYLERIIVMLFLLILAAGLTYISGAIDFASSFIGLGSTVSIILQSILILFSFIFYLPVLGYLSRMFIQDSPDFSFLESLRIGVKMLILILIYSIPFQLTLFVYGTFGMILSIAYFVLVLVLMPAIFMNFSEQKTFASAFKFNEITKRFNMDYLKKFMLALVIFLFYGFITYGIGTALLSISASQYWFYGVVGVYYVVYITMFLCMATTVVTLFKED